MDVSEFLSNRFGDSSGKPVDFIALSGNNGIRWLLPTQTRRVVRSLSEWRPYSVKGAVAWFFLRAAMLFGCLRLLPGTRLMPVSLSAVNWADFGWFDSRPPELVAYVGTPGPHRKIVVTLVEGSSGNSTAVLKFPVFDSAWNKIESESKVLRQLAGREHSPIAPRLISLNAGSKYSVQTFMPGSPSPAVVTNLHFEFLRKLGLSNSSISINGLIEKLGSRVSKLRSLAFGLDSRLDAIEINLANLTISGDVPTVWIHGDFAPWNLKISDDESLFAVDWEDASPLGLPCYDLTYFQLQVQHLLGKRVKIDWQVYLQALASLGYPIDLIDLEQFILLARTQFLLRQLEDDVTVMAREPD